MPRLESMCTEAAYCCYQNVLAAVYAHRKAVVTIGYAIHCTCGQVVKYFLEQISMLIKLSDVATILSFYRLSHCLD